MIRTQTNFYERVQSCMAPIYFFDKKWDPEDGQKTINGTLTLVQKEDKVFGITNHHVYKGNEDCKGYLILKNDNPNIICKIGNHEVALENRILYENEDNDLIVFCLCESDLEKIGSKNSYKSGFNIVDYRAKEYLDQQDTNNHESWPFNFAGYPGTDKIMKKVSHKKYEENFGIFVSVARGTYETIKGKEEIILDYLAVRESSEIVPHIGIFSDKNYDFGGISGGPVFTRTISNPDDLSLLGIVYNGSDINSSNSEFLYAKPISLLSEIL